MPSVMSSGDMIPKISLVESSASSVLENETANGNHELTRIKDLNRRWTQMKR
jgi:hypothetical protein